MDSLTQVVLGAAVGEAVLGKKVGNRAMLWGAVAGTIPDLDVFLRFFTDPVTAMEMHRGFSHSIVFSALMAPILGWLVHRIHRKREATRAGWSWLFWWSLVTHPLLDAHTTWGTQLFWPFEWRVTYKNIFVVDPLYTIPFLICLIIAMSMKRTNPRRRFFNNLGLIISTSYMALTFVFKGIGISAFKTELQNAHLAYTEMDTQPTPFNAILWSAQVETDSAYFIGYYSLFDSKPIRFSHAFPKGHDLLAPYLEQHVVQQLIRIADGWYTVQKEADGDLLFSDIRFGQVGFDPDNSPFMWQYCLHIDHAGKVQVQRLNGSMDLDMGEAMRELWKRIKGN